MGSAVRFLLFRGLLQKRRICSRCHDMILPLSDWEDLKATDGSDLGACDQQKQLKSDTWFQGSLLLYLDAISVTYCLSYEMNSLPSNSANES